jgi:hypothetical protein
VFTLRETDTSAYCGLKLFQRRRGHTLAGGFAPDIASLEINRIVNFTVWIVSQNLKKLNSWVVVDLVWLK